MEMIYVSSSAMLAIGYDSAKMQMNIQFADGDIYHFCKVPKSIFDGLRIAPSKGKFYNAYIRGVYEC